MCGRLAYMGFIVIILHVKWISLGVSINASKTLCLLASVIVLLSTVRSTVHTGYVVIYVIIL